ncbi:glycosyltransferase family 39 protein [Fluviicola sp.]|uniref:ArnT family glycosyltransferase n=1 Tax=Fluviicola sp. TaxID=1917219 RepID=UPI0026218191|nr:glycosyltransferase family 39 protein [Fluviicola sp.]
MKSFLALPVFKDIRFWIILFFLIRLYGITNPPLEVAHNWRQTTGTMVTRNFYEESANILYPRVDFAGEKTGITGMEFPLLNYIDYWVSELFGYQHWYGRLINLIVSSLGIWFFFRILKRYFSKETAFNASIILLSSIWFAYSRKIMPDTFAVSLVLMGFFYACRYFEEDQKKWLNLTLYALLTLFGVLAKLPTGFLLVLYAFFLFNKHVSINLKIVFFIISGIILAPIAWWYFSWVPYLVEKYQFWHFFMGKSIRIGAKELLENWQDGLKHFYDSALKFIGFGAFVIGLFFAFKRGNKLLLRILGLGFAAFLVIALKAGFTFTHHSYYIIPFVPIMALVAGYGISELKKRYLQIAFLVLIGFEGIFNQLHDFRLKEHERAFVKLESEMDHFSKRSDLIAVNTIDNPTAIYFAHHKGWVASNDELLDPVFRENIRKKGCKYIVVLKHYLGGDLYLELPAVVNNENWVIYKL